MMADALHFTGNEEADALLAEEPLALLIGFALDQQVPVQTAFSGPLKLKQRFGTLDARAIATADPGQLEQSFREKPAIHRFPGSMAKRVQEFLPDLRVEHLTRRGTAGVRAQVVDRHGNFIKEAIEIPGPHSFHVTNYNSPGATGSPAYTAWIVNLLGREGHLDHLKAKAPKPTGLWDFDAVCAAIEAPAG